ncbi:MAG: carboxypeptidase M32 [Rhodospirillales bacterium]|nr:carboxypeptidase M32 [Rhodospirillales bacterium]
MTEAAYQKLEQRFRRIGAIEDAGSVLQWDMAAIMPHGGAEARSEQLAAVHATAHRLLVDTETDDLLGAAEAERHALDSWQQANLGEMRRRWTHATALDERLVEALSKAGSACEMIWREARPAADFGRARPSLDHLLGLVRESASAKAAKLGLDPYDALLDLYDPGERAANIDRIFAELESFLPDLLGQVLERQQRDPAVIRPTGPFPTDKQRALAVRFMTAIGFDFDHGRLDSSLHPFCGGTPDDVRITTRYDEGDFTSSLMGVLHETGHALYERGLPAAWRRLPVGQARGMSVHESQSLLVEMQVCRSRSFLTFAAPLMAEAFGGTGPAWQVDNLVRLYTRVKPGFIRVDADEVTYPAHVMLRYRLERDLLADRLPLADLPAAWNAGMKARLGITPPSDRQGCLQDIHWYSGSFGYFPTYTLGAMTAAQLFAAAKASDSAIEAGIGGGNFKPLVSWLRRNVHEPASSLPTAELLRQATGRPLDIAAFKKHLEIRYLS